MSEKKKNQCCKININIVTNHNNKYCSKIIKVIPVQQFAYARIIIFPKSNSNLMSVENLLEFST